MHRLAKWTTQSFRLGSDLNQRVCRSTWCFINVDNRGHCCPVTSAINIPAGLSAADLATAFTTAFTAVAGTGGTGGAGTHVVARPALMT